VENFPDPSALGNAEARLAAAQTSASLGLPTDDAEAWRYSPIGDLDLARFKPSITPADVQIPAWAPVDAAATVEVVDGHIVSIELDSGWESKGLSVTADDSVSAVSVDDATGLDHLHAAFNPSALVVAVKAGAAIEAQVVIRSHLSAEATAFPNLKVTAGPDSQIEIIERQTSDGGGLTVGRVDVQVGDAALVKYLAIQELADDTWQLNRLTGSVGSQATLAGGMVAFGGAYARVRTDISLDGRGAHGDLVGVYYGDGDQIHDFRTFQHHRANNTTTDLLFKGAVDDKAGSVYTGLIHIHPEGAGSEAYQTNKNIKLCEDAWVWSVPNLEIENNDVKCSHASTVSPVDLDQRFYLHSRGVPPSVADRLIVGGFFNDVIARLPIHAAQADMASAVAAKLDERAQS
jgi:Fe-S cluster assembly protein SufD